MLELIGGPDRDRTGDLFHAMEARSQLRHRPTLRKDSFYSRACAALSQTGLRPARGSSGMLTAREAFFRICGNLFRARRCLKITE